LCSWCENKINATPDEIFDDASGDIAIGDLTSAVEKYGDAWSLIPIFSMVGTRLGWR